MAKKKIEKFKCAHCGTAVPATMFAKHLDTTKCGEYLRRPFERPFAKYVDVNVPSPAQAKARCDALVVTDGSTTAIELRRTETAVSYIPHSQAGYTVIVKDIYDFDVMYRPMPDYPPGRCAKLFIDFACSAVGATTEALVELETLIDITDHEKATAAKQLQGNTNKKTVVKKKMTAKGEVTMVKESKPRNSASAMFKNLIMQGDLTDEKIFEKVQKAFDLDDKKRSYVAWYRNALKKAGEKPPPKKGGAAPKATTKVTKKVTKVTKKKATKKVAKVTKKKATKKATKKGAKKKAS